MAWPWARRIVPLVVALSWVRLSQGLVAAPQGLDVAAVRRVSASRLRCPRVAAVSMPDEHDLRPVIEPERKITVRGEVVTPEGLMLSGSVFLVAALVQIPVLLCYLWGKQFDPKRRAGVDWVIHAWAKTSMAACGYIPEVVGLDNLRGVGNCLFVPNHTSFLDVLTLTGFIPRPMKYVSKEDILKIPFIGWPMKLAGHIPLQTDSRRSQLQTFKDTTTALSDGNSVITFPEGGRSSDGRIMPFKRGPFKMAMRSGVPIVPVSICGLAPYYPKGTLLPLAVPQGVRVIIHKPIDVSTCGLSEGELCRRAYDIVNDGLPGYQRGPPMAAS